MDPITAIQLASSLITFVDFATKIVTGTYEVYNSTTGSTVENAHISSVIGDLEDVAAGLEVDIPGNSKHERAIKELAFNCGKVANDLLLLLNKIKSDASNSTWKSLKATFISMRKQKDVAELEKRLNDYRSQILMRLTVMLQDQNCSLKLQLDKLEDASLNLSSESASRAKELRRHIFEDIKRLLDSKGPSNHTVPNSEDRLLELEQGLQDLSSLITTVPRENIILENLYYHSLDLRERSIVHAEIGTFEWLFRDESHQDNNNDAATQRVQDKGSGHESMSQQTDSHSTRYSPMDSTASPKFTENEPKTQVLDYESDIRYFEKQQLKRRHEARAQFVAWLNSGRGIFHISGKAGSGKSTLMKFICSHKRTEAELQMWAGEKKLVFAAFYFWKSQDESQIMQMSLEGLYRSILFTTLRQCPELIPAVFPTHWEKLKNDCFTAGSFISYHDLISALGALTRKGAFTSHRFCYFVDGLDEYHGESLDHLRLAKSLQLWTRGPDVKICASSRPYIEYEKLSLSLDHVLHLHHLTRHDIYLFCRQMMEKDDNFEQIKDSYLNLVGRIVQRSRGVFLWARLVVNSPLVGMLRHDNIQTLEKKLDAIPGDLNKLYHQLLNSLDKVDRERAIKMLLITAYPPYDHTTVTYWMFENFDRLAFNPNDRVRPSSWPSAATMASDACLQIKSLTKGLLEIQSKRVEDIDIQKVDFFHRTAQDFVLEQLRPTEQYGAKKPYHGYSGTKLNVGEEKYARIRLAELISYDIRTRKVVWSRYFTHWPFRTVENLSLEVMNGYRHFLDDYDKPIPADCTSLSIFLGSTYGPNGVFRRMHRLSFVHLAAYMGQTNWVLHEIETNPALLDWDQELNILASAASNSNIELVEALIERGCSPATSISCWHQAILKDRPDGIIPIWKIILHQDLGYILKALHMNIRVRRRTFSCWELLLRHLQVYPRNCFFLLSCPDEDTPSHFITLRQVVEQVELEGRDKLLRVLDGSQGNSFIKRTTEFLWRFIPAAGKLEPNLATKTDKYIPYLISEKKNIEVRAIVCGDVQTDICRLRLY